MISAKPEIILAVKQKPQKYENPLTESAKCTELV